MELKQHLEQFRDDGYTVQHEVFRADELELLRDAAERVASRVTKRARRPGAGAEIELGDGHRIQFSSRTAIQWEWREGSEQIRLLERILLKFIQFH